MLKKRANSFNTGIAAEYFILSQLYRRDIEAYVSQGNKKAIDIRIIKLNGKTISVDVKSVRGYTSLVVNNVVAQDGHYLVFVVYNDKFEKLDIYPDVFIVPSLHLPKLVKIFKKEKRVMKNSLLSYKDKWEYLL